MYVRRMPDGTAKAATTAQELFGDLLTEKHPTYGFTDKDGTWHAYSRYTVCHGAVSLYEPKSAAALAKMRATRERNKAAKEDAAWAEANPLWAQAGYDGREV